MEAVRAVICGIVAILGVGFGAQWVFTPPSSPNPAPSPAPIQITQNFVIRDDPRPKPDYPTVTPVFVPVESRATGPCAEAIAARDYSFDGVRLGMSFSEFIGDRKTATRNTESRDMSVWFDTVAGASLGYFTFRDNYCVGIKVVYFHADLTRFGGRSAIETKARQLFGAPHDHSDRETMGWTFRDVDRHVRFTYHATKNKADSVDLEVADTKAGHAGLGVGN